MNQQTIQANNKNWYHDAGPRRKIGEYATGDKRVARGGLLNAPSGVIKGFDGR